MTHRERIFTLGAALSSAMLGASLLAGSPGAPQVSVEEVNPGTSVERRLCLSVSLAPGAASECGDLRLAHALPAVRTLGQARAPVLLYNRQHASPRPIVAANVVLPNGSSGLSRVVATLIGGLAADGAVMGGWNLLHTEGTGPSSPCPPCGLIAARASAAQPPAHGTAHRRGRGPRRAR